MIDEAEFTRLWEAASPAEREAFFKTLGIPPPKPRGSLRFSLSAVKGVGDSAARSIVEERERNGKYLSVADFARRLDTKAVNKKALLALIGAGALDTLNPNRGLLAANVEAIMDYARQSSRDAETGEGTIRF